MHIPERYRDRYDRLALSHPWMREMRDEPTNAIDGETNVNPDGSPLVEGDAADMLRKYVEECESANGKAGTRGKRLLQIADMVERDYVKREFYVNIGGAFKRMKAESDKLKTMNEKLQVTIDAVEGCDERCKKLEAERDDAHKQWEHWSKLATDIIALFYPVEEEGLPNDAYNVVKDSASKLTAERDELKRKEKQLSNELGLHNRAIELLQDVKQELIEERDEWRAKYLGAMNDAEDYKTLWQRSREGSSKVRAGSSNLEWLVENDRDFATDWMSKASYCSHCAFWDDCDGSMGSEDPKCIRGNREWLLAPHSDPLSDSESSQRACESSQREPESAHSKTQSKTEPKLTEQPESLSDEADTREKLEVDVNAALYGASMADDGYIPLEMAIGWLDRQAAITANETIHDNPYVGLVRGKQWERTEISDYYCGRCGWRVTDHDSYCPECGGALHKAPNKPDGKFDARETAETPETDTAKDDMRDFDDSREKLEDDIQSDLAALSEYGKLMLDWDVVIDWLDRQDEITRRELQGEVGRLARENASLADDLAESEMLRAGR